MSHFLTRSLQERLDLVEPEGATEGQVLKAVDIGDGIIVFQPGTDDSGGGGVSEMINLTDTHYTLLGDVTDTGLILSYDHDGLDGAGWYAINQGMPLQDPMADLDAAAQEAADGKILQWVWDPAGGDGSGAGDWSAQDAPAGGDPVALDGLTDVEADPSSLAGGEVLTFIPASAEHGLPEDEDYMPATDAHFAMQASVEEGGHEAALCSPEEIVTEVCDSTTKAIDLSDGTVVFLMGAWSLAGDGSEVCAVELTLGGEVTVGRHCFIVDDGLETGRMVEVTVAGGEINGSADPVELSDNATVHLLCTSFSDPDEGGDGSSKWVIL